MTCCDNPAPRVLESSGRLFCGNCRRYLDTAAQSPPKASFDHHPHCVAASLPTTGKTERDHSGGRGDCDCPCHDEVVAEAHA